MNLIETIINWYRHRKAKYNETDSNSKVETSIDNGNIINGVEFVKPDDDIKDQNYWD